jgi:hypothetical protein
MFFSSFSNDIIPFFIFSHILYKLVISDKKFSSFSLILVTSNFIFSFNSFSSVINFFIFTSYDLNIFLLALSYSLSISPISSSILFFNCSNFLILLSNSLLESLIVIFSFFKDSSSSISKILCPS